MKIEFELWKEADNLQEGKEGKRCHRFSRHEYDEDEITNLVLRDLRTRGIGENEEYRNTVHSLRVGKVTHD